MDGVGHTIETQLTSDPISTVYSDTTYDGLGRVATKSNRTLTSGPLNRLGETQERLPRFHPVETQLAFTSIGDAADLLRILLDGGHSPVAGRRAGGFRRAERGAITD